MPMKLRQPISHAGSLAKAAMPEPNPKTLRPIASAP